MNPLPINAIKPIAGESQIWRADELAASQGKTVPTGDALLNAQLPGGGWPVGALVEVLQAHTGHNDWRLLLPALVKTEGVLVLVGAPHAPFAPGLAGQGLDPARLLCVNTPTPAARLWAAEQALRCKDVAAVLAWLPQARADALRRLQISAAEHHKLLFVMRPARAQHESSPAVLRVITAHPATSGPTASNSAVSNPAASPPAASGASALWQADALRVHIFKRRGPPLEQALTLVARPARLGALMAVQAMALSGAHRAPRVSRILGAGHGAVQPEAISEANCLGTQNEAVAAEVLDFPPTPPERRHALDRVAAAA